METKKHNNKYFNYVKYSSLATQMIIIIAGGTFGGLKLDKILHTTPLFVVTLSTLSVIIAIYIALKDVIKK